MSSIVLIGRKVSALEQNTKFLKDLSAILTDAKRHCRSKAIERLLV